MRASPDVRFGYLSVLYRWTFGVVMDARQSARSLLKMVAQGRREVAP
ncbi:hypothetical protein ACFOY2_26445 [Nonomuraea purpurea]|uniref:Uncharacterized protein n=1 Tax=Nonomuraea purpurea TaxID=1849276 RepID=A0ABV8GCR4_9ACTN